MASEKYSNDGSTTLNGAINNSTTTVVVTDASKFPLTPQFRIRVEAEIMLVTAVSSNTFTVTRGQEGTTGASHSDLTAVYHTLTKGAIDQILADGNMYGTCANLPAAERAGRLYFGSDYPMMYRDTGSAWQAFYNGRPCTCPVASNYTFTHGGPTATSTQVTNGPVHLEITSNAGGDRTSVFVKALSPTSNYTKTVRIGYHTQSTSVTTYAGFCLYDGTKNTMLGIIGESSTWRPFHVKQNNLVSYNGEYFRVGLPIDPTDFWLRFVDDGSNRITYYSNDGVNFVFLQSNGRTDFLTPTHYGISLTTNAASGIQCRITWFSDE